VRLGMVWFVAASTIPFGANRFLWKARIRARAVILDCKKRTRNGWLSVLLEAIRDVATLHLHCLEEVDGV
jgi:hypothetical protein